MTHLFHNERVTLHSGRKSSFKIECDALTDQDISTIAQIFAKKFEFSRVYGIPRGGTRLEAKLKPLEISGSPFILIVDDVLSTGASFERAVDCLPENRPFSVIKGVCIFSRGPCPSWVTPFLQLHKDFQDI